MKKAILILVGFTFFMLGHAQDTATSKASAIGFKLGILDFKKTNATDKLSKTVPYFGIQFFKGINAHLDGLVNLDIAFLKYPYAVSKLIPQAKTNQNYFAIDANLNYKFSTDDKKVVPYITGGIGLATDHGSYYTAYAPIGAGIQLKANQGSFINISSTYRAELSTLTKTHFAHYISYTFPLKLKNKLPVMIPSAPVSSDEDQDGVFGNADDCPNQSGLVKYHGCPIPDADEDGVNDENDPCPTAPGFIKYHGCPIPDADKDGINDEEDKCPKEKGVDQYQGCPIPNKDKDSIIDEEDHVSPNLQPMMDRYSSNLKFASGKTVLKKQILSGLDSIVKVMNAYPKISLAIGGHTDNTGALKINQKLSAQRAVVVSTYLIKKGVTKKRLTTSGYADTKPIGDNKTIEGRAKNRRTDVIVLY